MVNSIGFKFVFWGFKNMEISWKIKLFNINLNVDAKKYK